MGIYPVRRVAGIYPNLYPGLIYRCIFLWDFLCYGGSVSVLITPINTIPPKTLEQFIDHGTVKLTLESDLDEAQSELDSLPELGIHLYDVTQELLNEGVEKFTESYDTLIKTIADKKVTLVTT